MRKIMMILSFLLVTQTMAGNNRYQECVFIDNEIKKYSYYVAHARDIYEYNRFVYILNQYKGSFNRYCIPQTRTNDYGTNPFRQQQDRSGGYLGP